MSDVAGVSPITEDAAPLAELAALAAELGLQLSTEQAKHLLRYLGMLERWNSIYNLTAVRSREGMWTQHLADCLAVISPLRKQISSGRVLDVGSGGGLPGVVVATCLPQVEVSCVDAVGKKAAFVRQAAGELGLTNLFSIHGRVEAMQPPPFEVIISRAFGSLAHFAALTRGALAPGGLWLAMKGKTPDDELAALPATVEVFHVEQLKVPGLNASRCLVWMRARRDLS